MEFGTNAVLEDLCASILMTDWHAPSLARAYRQMHTQEDGLLLDSNNRGRVGELWLASAIQLASMQNSSIHPDIFPYGRESARSKLSQKPYRSIALKGKSLFNFAEYDAVLECACLPVVFEMKAGKNNTKSAKKSTMANQVCLRLSLLNEYFRAPAMGYVLVVPADWKKYDFAGVQGVGGKVVILDKSADELQVISDRVTSFAQQMVPQKV